MLNGEFIDIACVGKEPFRSWSKANVALKRTAHSQNNVHDKRKLAIYRCKGCGGWHIGGSDRDNRF